MPMSKMRAGVLVDTFVLRSIQVPFARLSADCASNCSCAFSYTITGVMPRRQASGSWKEQVDL
jgi:hypothetical protein